MAKKVLIVDDDKLILKFYKAIVAAEGYQIKTAEDGQEALSVAAEFKPDLIILDILMPVMNGMNFLRNFDCSRHPETKVVIFSNSASADNLEEALKLGAVEFKIKSDIKPYDIKNLVNNYLNPLKD